MALGVLAIIAVLFSTNIPYANISQSAPTSETAQIKASHQAFDSNDLDGARAAAESVLSNDPNNISALLAKASALAQKGSLEFKENEYGPQAIQVAQQVLALDPKNSEAWRLIGYGNEIMQRYDDAHAAYAKAVELDSRNALAVAGDAHAWDLQGDMMKAEAGYRRALDLDPSTASARTGLARVLVYQNKLDEALVLYTALARNTVNIRQRAEAAYSAGQLEEMTGAYESAEDHFIYAVDTDPTYALGYVGLAGELFRQSLVDNPPPSPETRANLVREAISNFHSAIGINPNQSLAHYQLAMVMTALGRINDSLVVLNNMNNTIINKDITLSAAAKAAMQKDVQAAIDKLVALRAKS